MRHRHPIICATHKELSRALEMRLNIHRGTREIGGSRVELCSDSDESLTRGALERDRIEEAA